MTNDKKLGAQRGQGHGGRVRVTLGPRPIPGPRVTCPCLTRRDLAPWGHGAVLTGAGGGRRVQCRPVVAEVAAAGLGGRGRGVAVGRAAGAELVPGGRLVEAQLTGCGGEGGLRDRALGPRAPQGTAVQTFRITHFLFSSAGAGTEAQRRLVTYTGMHSKPGAERRLGP